jgi:drug/metabolite transporter (DMT)-like permease
MVKEQGYRSVAADPTGARLSGAGGRGSWQSMSPPTSTPASSAASPSSAELLARLAAPTFVVIWATGFIIARLIAPYTDALTFLAVRFALVIGALALLAGLARAPWPSRPRAWRDAFVAGILIHGVYLGGVFVAIKEGMPAGISALIAGLQPLIAAALVGPLLGEAVSRRRWLGIALGFLGAALVIAPRLSGVGAFPAVTLVASIVSVLSMTLGTIWQKRTGTTLDLRTGTAVQFMGALAVTLPGALLFEELRIEPTPELLFGLAWSVLVLSIGGIAILLTLIRKGAVAGVSALLYLVPPVAALMAFVLFDEALSPVQMVGMALAAVGVAIASRG